MAGPDEGLFSCLPGPSPSHSPTCIGPTRDTRIHPRSAHDAQGPAFPAQHPVERHGGVCTQSGRAGQKASTHCSPLGRAPGQLISLLPSEPTGKELIVLDTCRPLGCSPPGLKQHEDPGPSAVDTCSACALKWQLWPWLTPSPFWAWLAFSVG